MKKIIILVVIVVLVIIGIFVFNYNSVPEGLQEARVQEAVQIPEQNQQQEEDSINENQTDQFLGDSENLSSADLLSSFGNPKLTFTGYGPAGKSHEGIFKEVEVDGNRFIFKTSSIETGIDDLDSHLCREDFFDCSNNPEAIYEITSIENNNGVTTVSGNLSFRDMVKNVSFDLTGTENGFGTDFLLDISEFGFTYPGIEDQVRIQIEA